MNALLRALSAERIKLRGTLALWMCLIAPAVVVALQVLQMSVRGPGDRPPLPPAEAWMMFSYSGLGLWAFLMLPLFITLQSALLAGLEHQERHWKHLLALPVPPRVHYLAKALVLVAMVLVATAVLVLLIALGGGIMTWSAPGFGIGGAPPWALLLPNAAMIVGASLLMVALHTWIAIRWPSFTVAVAIGMSATVMSFIIGQSERFGHWYPWSLPLQVLSKEQAHLGFALGLSAVGALLVTVLGLLNFLRRETA